ncbi:MAG: hypothetical protein HXS48_17990 [Theionarchaea archaeon]|nr:hypothetical protein [Theionarchaea archaeon]
MNKKMWNMKVKGVLILIAFVVIVGCLIQEDPFRQIIVENLEQCVTPLCIYSSFNVRPGGISMTSDGSLIAARHTMGGVYLFNIPSEVVWSNDNFGGQCPMITKDGSYLITQIRRLTAEEPFFLVKADQNGSIIWKKEIDLSGIDALSMTPDASFVALGYVDQDEKGHLILFDQDGNKLWDHQIDGRIETVAVSKSGYVVAGPQDRYIYVYDRNGELIFKYFTGSWYDPQNAAIAPDETFFLFVSEHKYLNCHTLEGRFLWQKEVGDLCNLQMSADGEYIAAATFGELFLFDESGNELWSKVVSSVCIREIAISAHGEYIAVDVEKGFFSLVSAFEVYNKEGGLLWRYEEEQPFRALAISEDGHYLAAGSGVVLLFFDNFAAIREYNSSECAQSNRFLTFYYL